MAMKYIVFQAGSFEIPVIFPDVISHARVARGIKAGLENEFANVEVISAGFARIDCEAAGGDSLTLETKSRPEDKNLINMCNRT